MYDVQPVRHPHGSLDSYGLFVRSTRKHLVEQRAKNVPKTTSMILNTLSTHEVYMRMSYLHDRTCLFHASRLQRDGSTAPLAAFHRDKCQEMRTSMSCTWACSLFYGQEELE